MGKHFGSFGVFSTLRAGTTACVEHRPEQPVADDSPYDDHGRVDVPDAPGWQYLSIHGHPDAALEVELAGPDGVCVAFTVPNFLNRGDELGEVARIVIRSWERKERAAGLGA
jgi:hypothetical protein